MINSLRVAIIFDQKATAGGGYHQAISNIYAIKDISKDNIQFITYSTQKKSVDILKQIGIDSIFMNLGWNKIFMLSFRKMIITSFGWKIANIITRSNSIERLLKKSNIDLVYFPSQSFIPNFLEETNYIYTLFDLCHRENVEFPEIRARGVFEKRENFFSNVLKRAYAIVVDSAITKKNAINYYQIDESRIYLSNFSPSKQVIENKVSIEYAKKVLKEYYKIEGDYIYYPAHFWAHKNHIFILQALKILRDDHGITLRAIFTGTDKGVLDHIKKSAEIYGISGQIKYLGHIPEFHVSCMYLCAIALVMPTYFGPTNLPPLEAFALGCPVIYPNISNYKDQVGNAVIPVDLNNPEELAASLIFLSQNESFKIELINRGKHKLSELEKDENLAKVLDVIFNKFIHIRQCW